MDNQAVKIIQKYEALANDKTKYRNLWQELSDYLIPGGHDFIGGTNQGNTLDYPEIYDGTGPDAVSKAAAGLYSRGTNPSSKWFLLRPPMGLENNKEVVKWLDNARDVTQEAINAVVALPLHEVYTDLLVLGTGCMFIEEDPDERIRASAIGLENIEIEENAKGLIDSVYRRFVFTPQQAEEAFGKDSLHEAMRHELDNDSTTYFEFIHVVRPRKDRDSRKLDSLNYKYESVYVDRTNSHIVKESGYKSFPYAVPRLYRLSGEKFGRSPGMTALPDVKTLNQYERDFIDAVQMQIRPPLDVPEDAIVSPIRMIPGAVHYNQDTQGRKITPINVVGNLQFSYQERESKRAAIRSIFFNDLLQLSNGSTRMTKLEVRERVENQMELLGPWVGRLSRELFEPIIVRCFQILVDADVIPSPPAILQERAEYSIEYDSPLARAQKVSDLQAIDATVQSVMAMAQIGKDTSDLFDVDGIMRKRARIVGMPEAYIRDEEEVAQERMEKMKMMQQQAAMQQMEAASKSLKNVADVPGVQQQVQAALGGGA